MFYEALKKTRDIGEQANSEDIRAELERSDSLEQLVPHLGSRTQKDPFNAKPGTLRSFLKGCNTNPFVELLRFIDKSSLIKKCTIY